MPGKKNKFITDEFDDPTFGGLFPFFTQERWTEEIEDAELLWDGRAMVFWRSGSVSDDPYSSTTWKKQSVILRLFGDESDEVLYSVNTKDLVQALGLNTDMNSGLDLQVSRFVFRQIQIS